MNFFEDPIGFAEDKWIERRSTDEMKQFRFGFRLDTKHFNHNFLYQISTLMIQDDPERMFKGLQLLCLSLFRILSSVK